MGRRRLLIDLLRYAVAGVLGAVGYLLAAGRSNVRAQVNCVDRGLCAQCPIVERCDVLQRSSDNSN
jgi:hypothetical protein